MQKASSEKHPRGALPQPIGAPLPKNEFAPDHTERGQGWPFKLTCRVRHSTHNGQGRERYTRPDCHTHSATKTAVLWVTSTSGPSQETFSFRPTQRYMAWIKSLSNGFDKVSFLECLSSLRFLGDAAHGVEGESSSFL